MLHRIAINLSNKLLKPLDILQVPRDSRKSLKPIPRMMIRRPPLFQGLFPQLSNLLRNFLPRDHTDIGADAEGRRCRLGIAVEGSGIEEDEVSGFVVYFLVVAERLFCLVGLREEVPVLFAGLEIFLVEVLTVIEMGLWDYDEAAVVVAVFG